MGVTVFGGIDPGKSGGLVFKYPYKVQFAVMPSKIVELADLLEELQHRAPIDEIFICLEKVSGYQGNIEKDLGSSMFQFGRNYGQIETCLQVAGYTLGKHYMEVHPRTWQAKLGIKPRSKGETDEQFKRRLKEMAEELFPAYKVTGDTADAFLLCHYCELIAGEEDG
jgi:hypothetical protein